MRCSGYRWDATGQGETKNNRGIFEMSLMGHKIAENQSTWEMLLVALEEEIKRAVWGCGRKDWRL